MPDLLAVTFTARPQRPGQPLAGLFHALPAILTAQPAADPAPYRLAVLAEPAEPARPPADATFTLRLTSLTAPLSHAILTALQAGGPLAPGAALTTDTGVFHLLAVALDTSAHPWAGRATYADLSAPWLLARQTPERQFTLQWAAPTTFAVADRLLPMPLPGLVFAHLKETWNTFAPVALPDELDRYAEDCLALAGFSLRSRTVPVKQGRLHNGAVGTTRYHALTADRYWLSLVHLLAEYAFFAGAGAHLTLGLGMCRKLPSASPSPLTPSPLPFAET